MADRLRGVVYLGFLFTVACGGATAPIDGVSEAAPSPAPAASVGDDERAPPPPGGDHGRGDPPTDAAYPYPTVTDLQSRDAAAVCSERSRQEEKRVLGTFRADRGWTMLDRARGVEAAFWQGGGNAGGSAPIIVQDHLGLTFPLPSIVDPAGPTHRAEERVFHLAWPTTDQPADLFKVGTRYEVTLTDDSWRSSCSANGRDWSHAETVFPRPTVVISIAERTEQIVAGTIERAGPSGVELLTFEAPLTGSLSTDNLPPGGEVCCLGRY